MWENMRNIWGNYGKHGGKIWGTYGENMGKIGETYGENMEHIFGTMIFDLLYRDVVIGKAFKTPMSGAKLMGNI